MGNREEKLSEIGRMIIEGAKSDLYVSMRYLDLAIFALSPVEDDRVELMGTDGRSLFYSPKDITEEYKKGRLGINRCLLHSIFHCLFRHFYGGTKYVGKDGIYWDMACDIAAEYLIDDIKVHAVSTIVSRYRTYIYKRLSLEMDILTAEGIFQSLKKWDISDSDFKIMYKAFRTDDHGFWPRPQKNDPPSGSGAGSGGGSDTDEEMFGAAKKAKDNWDDLSRRTLSQAEHLSRGEDSGDKSIFHHLKASNRRRYDYGEFLRRFAVYGEEAKPDPDNFDIGFYTYGMTLYGNMPIIEPNESREVKKVSDFVIVLDTSASCSGEAIKSFLEETFGILKLRESFFRRVRIHVIQCDSRVRKDTVITCPEDIDKLMEKTELSGFGGTDFRPAFEYVEGLKDELTNMKGLIYFTDGEGIFPEKPTPYETAFVFLRDSFHDAEVPPWAIKLILDSEELTQ